MSNDAVWKSVGERTQLIRITEERRRTVIGHPAHHSNRFITVIDDVDGGGDPNRSTYVDETKGASFVVIHRLPTELKNLQAHHQPPC